MITNFRIIEFFLPHSRNSRFKKRHKDIRTKKFRGTSRLSRLLSRIIELSNFCHIRVIRGLKKDIRAKEQKNFASLRGCHDCYHEPLARNRMGAIFELSNFCHIRAIRGLKKDIRTKEQKNFASLRGKESPQLRVTSRLSRQ